MDAWRQRGNPLDVSARGPLAGSQRAQRMLQAVEPKPALKQPSKQKKSKGWPQWTRFGNAKKPKRDHEAERKAAAAEAVRMAKQEVVRSVPGAPEEDEWRPSAAPAPRRFEAAAKAQFFGTTAVATARRPGENGSVYEDPGRLLAPRLLERLRPHQTEGCAFICRRLNCEGGGCLLSDEMGLGKTATTLAAVAILLGIEGSALEPSKKSCRAVVACPAGVANTWLTEAKKWLVPTARGAARHAAGGVPHCALFADVGESKVEAGRQRRRRRLEARGRDWGKDDADDAIARFERASLDCKPVLVVSYETYRSRADELNAIADVGILVCDEAHRLKAGDSAQVYDAIDASPARRRLLVTATPVQNGIGELRALLRLARVDLDGDDESAVRNALRRCALRRCIDDTAAIRSAMPTKVDTLVFCAATDAQRAARPATVDGRASALRAITAACLACSTLGRSAHDDLESCGKWRAAVRLLDAIAHDTDDRVVLISRFTAVLDAGAALATDRGWPHARLDGATALDARVDIQRRLNSRDAATPPLFLALVSLRAGGVGLNLVGASRIILFEPSWNPADDDQAVARVWRFGQERPVFVYRLVTAHSIEERVVDRQNAKRSLAACIRRECCGRAADFLVAQAKVDPSDDTLIGNDTKPTSVDDLIHLADADNEAPCGLYPDSPFCSTNDEGALEQDPILRAAVAHEDRAITFVSHTATCTNDDDGTALPEQGDERKQASKSSCNVLV